MPQDNDDFWNIALSEESVKDAFFQSQDEDVDDKEEDHDSEEISAVAKFTNCLLYTSPSPRDRTRSRMPSSA